MNKKDFRFNDIGIVGTYECNKDCSYCFSEKYIKPFKGKELSLERFQEIVDILKRNGTDSIMFLGGEPGLWTHINEAIAYAKSIGLKTTVFSNCTVKITEHPDVFFVHLNVLFLFKDKVFLKNLYEYAKKSKIVFLYNIYKPNKYGIELIKNVFKSFKFDYAVSIGIIFGEDITKQWGTMFYDMTKFLTSDLQKKVYASGPVPMCAFDDKQFFYLKAKIGLGAVCGSPAFVNTDAFTVVNPDGETILPCPPMHEIRDIKYLLDNDIAAYIMTYSKEMRELRKRKPKMCEGCDLYRTKCQAGCIVGRYTEEESKSITLTKG